MTQTSSPVQILITIRDDIGNNVTSAIKRFSKLKERLGQHTRTTERFRVNISVRQPLNSVWIYPKLL